MIVSASVAANVFVINGEGKEKDLTQLLPGILSQIGPENLASLQKIAESLQAQTLGKGEEDDEIPALEENL